MIPRTARHEGRLKTADCGRGPSTAWVRRCCRPALRFERAQKADTATG